MGLWNVMNINDYTVNNKVLNYTQVKEVYGDEFNLAPRSMIYQNNMKLGDTDILTYSY